MSKATPSFVIFNWIETLFKSQKYIENNRKYLRNILFFSEYLDWDCLQIHIIVFLYIRYIQEAEESRNQLWQQVEKARKEGKKAASEEIDRRPKNHSKGHASLWQAPYKLFLYEKNLMLQAYLLMLLTISKLGINKVYLSIYSLEI